MTNKQNLSEKKWSLAEKFTEETCKILDLECWEIENEVEQFTQEAQDIFSSFVDLLDNL